MITCPYCQESYNYEDIHLEEECRDLLIDRICAMLNQVDNFVLKQIFNYITNFSGYNI